jgi:two-component system LytT family response regulator
MKRVILIDDEPLARMLLREYLEAHKEIEIIAECQDGFEGVKAIQQWSPDLIFLDIQMPKINGFEMLELIESPPPIIFTTAFDEYAIRAFESHAIDYLLKPFSQERLDKALRKWEDAQGAARMMESTAPLLQEAGRQAPQNQRIVVKTGSKIKIIPVQDVHYLEAADDYVKIQTADASFLKNKTMQHFEQSLDPAQFVRTHRSYMVNIQLIERIDPYEKENHIAILKSGARVPVSRTGYGKLKLVLGL